LYHECLVLKVGYKLDLTLILFRFKVHLEVIDNTGSITFILFDRVVSQFVGRSAQDLLDSISDVGFNVFFFCLPIGCDILFIFIILIS
jgi:hypothetical protein